MSRGDTYVQVPHLLSSDPRFAPVYNDRAVLGAWLQMYLVADECYPNPAPLPRVDQATLDAIAAAGLIELQPGDRYIVPGLADHRRAASDHARVAAWARWGNAGSNAPGNAGSNAQVMPTKKKTLTNESSNARSIKTEDRSADTEPADEWMEDLDAERGGVPKPLSELIGSYEEIMARKPAAVREAASSRLARTIGLDDAGSESQSGDATAAPHEAGSAESAPDQGMNA